MRKNANILRRFCKMHSILDYFELTVSRFPDKTAIADKSSAYTFSGLKTAASKLGRTISAAAEQKNVPVGVLVNRGAETAVLFLAALFGSCYYVPIDPDMPPAKIETILHDADIRLLLGSDENRELVEGLNYAGTFLTQADAADEPADAPDLGEKDPIYMVYTSGSTGKPKGVLKSHGAVISFIKAFTETFQLGSGEIIGNQTPFFFDASAKDFYYMIYSGATLEVLGSELFIFPVTLIEYMNQRKVTYVCWVPTALAIVTQLNTFKKVVPETLRHVFFVGEVFPVKQLRKWIETLPDIRYINLYGSSEISGICCWYPIPTDQPVPDILPLGHALGNCEVLLMDEGKVIETPGEVGELYVISDALADGYFNDPEKTKATFVTLSLPDGRSERALRSGDLARIDEDGNLLFVSRKDFQIKHMGRRIELGEIEAAADNLPDVDRCCCLYDEKRKMIKLYCELTAGSTADGKTIQSALRSKLSDYMVPGKVIVLDQMPFNANGKIDRQRLKEMK